MVEPIVFSLCRGAMKISSPSLQEALYPKVFFQERNLFQGFRDNHLQTQNECISLHDKFYFWGNPPEAQWNQLELHVRAPTIQ